MSSKEREIDWEIREISRQQVGREDHQILSKKHYIDDDHQVIVTMWSWFSKITPFIVIIIKMTITTKAIFQEKWEELKRCLMEERVEVHFYDK